MTNTFAFLDAKRIEFNRFASSSVSPLIGLSTEQMDMLGFAAVAKLIIDLNVRKRYCELAIAMLDANIVHHIPDTILIPVQKINNTAAIASTLAIAAIALYLNGAVAALFASAAWYWLADKTSHRRLKQLNNEANAHNEHVTDWARTLKGWEIERTQLLSL